MAYGAYGTAGPWRGPRLGPRDGTPRREPEDRNPEARRRRCTAARAPLLVSARREHR